MANPEYEVVDKNSFARALKGGLRIELTGDYEKDDRVILFSNDNPYQYYIKVKIKSLYHGKYKVVQPVRVYPNSSKRWVVKTIEPDRKGQDSYLAIRKDDHYPYFTLNINEKDTARFDNELEANEWTNPLTEAVLYDFETNEFEETE